MENILKINIETSLHQQQIVYFKSDVNYTYVHTFERAYLSSRTLKVLATRIDCNNFMKIRRGLLVNKLFIAQLNLDQYFPFVEMVNGDRFVLSRRVLKAIKEN